MKRTIQLSIEQAKSLYDKDNELRETLLADFTDEELGIDNFPKSWKELKRVNGKYLNNVGYICSAQTYVDTVEGNKNIAQTEKDCKSILAFCQLKQLAKRINDNQNDDEWIDWESFNTKYRIYYSHRSKIFSVTNNNGNAEAVIYFKRKEDALRSIKEHKDLWLQYFGIEE